MITQSARHLYRLAAAALATGLIAGCIAPAGEADDESDGTTAVVQPSEGATKDKATDEGDKTPAAPSAKALLATRGATLTVVTSGDPVPTGTTSGAGGNPADLIFGGPQPSPWDQAEITTDMASPAPSVSGH
ncbi:MAG: hypothetical protein ACLQVI_12035 [Polyangiaceae bacterium]